MAGRSAGLIRHREAQARAPPWPLLPSPRDWRVARWRSWRGRAPDRARPCQAAPRRTRGARRGPLAPLLQADAAATRVARRALVDEIDAEAIERGDELHQGLDVAPDHPVARLHALDGGQR